MWLGCKVGGRVGNMFVEYSGSIGMTPPLGQSWVVGGNFLDVKLYLRGDRDVARAMIKC